MTLYWLRASRSPVFIMASGVAVVTTSTAPPKRGVLLAAGSTQVVMTPA